MHTNNAFFWSDADEFVHGGFFVLFVHHREIKRPERRLICGALRKYEQKRTESNHTDLDCIAIFLAGLRFGQAYRSDGWVPKDLVESMTQGSNRK